MKLSTFLKAGVPLIIVITFVITLLLSLIGMNNLNRYMYEELAIFKAKNIYQKVLDLQDLSNEFSRNFTSDFATLWSLSLKDYNGLIDNAQSAFERYRTNSYVNGINFYTKDGKYYATIGLAKKKSQSTAVEDVIKQQKEIKLIEHDSQGLALRHYKPLILDGVFVGV
ncbi:MAG: hypothetical protein N2Z58_08720 [Fervidobacterium sp.]|nr:hypothetical protein [Fervidobacterium sp.]